MSFDSIINALYSSLFQKRIARKEAKRRNALEWFSDNDQKYLFFFPCKKVIQEEIFKKIIPNIDQNIHLAYYNGPQVICTLEPFPEHYFLKLAYSNDDKIKLGSPCILQLVNKNLIFRLELSELLTILDGDFDSESVVAKVNNFIAIKPTKDIQD
ncbi:MAG: hypothetical protein QMC70_07335 [Bacteroidia bacterium]|jgi:hypothetical protein|tara:strand:- start:483 stop:947 length:465 start_codon:yes stop_codon:yes gene_type:complete